MEIYKSREYDLQNAIDTVYCLDGLFQNYRDEVNSFINNLLKETVEINTLRNDVKEKDKEIEKLTAESTEWESKCYKYQDIIDEIESIVYADISNIDARISIQEVLDKLKEGK